MELLGLNPVLLLAQLVSFGVLFFVLKKFLFSSIRKSLEDRTEKIRQIQENNLEFDKKLQKFEDSKSDFEKKNQEELRKLLLETQKSANEIKKEILEQADLRSKKILEEATARIEQEKNKASNELRNEAGLLAREMAAKILTEPANSKKVLEISINELKQLKPKSK